MVGFTELPVIGFTNFIRGARVRTNMGRILTNSGRDQARFAEPRPADPRRYTPAMDSTTRLVRLGLGAVAGLLLAACGGDAGPGGRTNLLLVVFDTTRADHISCYGHARNTTPYVDSLAAGGTRFDELRSQSSLTPVSAATLLSGTQPYRHGVRSLFVVGEQRMSAGVPSLFELLGAAGRRTAAFVSAKPMGRHYGLARGFDEYDDDLSDTRSRYGIEGFADAPQRPAEETTDRALAWLDDHGDEPFAMMLHYFDAHDASFVPPREFLEEHVSFELPPQVRRYAPGPRSPIFTASMANVVDLYDAEIRYMDEQLRRVGERLDQLGVLDDTLIAFVADHGEAFGEHDFYTHGLLYEEHLHVPLVLNGPGIPEGRVVETRAGVVDFAATIAELLDLPAPAQDFDGVSLVPLLAAEADARDIYAEVHHAAGDSRGREPELYSLTAGDWKYVHRPHSGAHELFDLARDPRELTNLYTPDDPRAQVMLHRIEALGAIDGVVPSTEGMSEAAIEELRALGYL